jgi:hypothetical protein
MRAAGPARPRGRDSAAAAGGGALRTPYIGPARAAATPPPRRPRTAGAAAAPRAAGAASASAAGRAGPPAPAPAPSGNGGDPLISLLEQQASRAPTLLVPPPAPGAPPVAAPPHATAAWAAWGGAGEEGLDAEGGGAPLPGTRVMAPARMQWEGMYRRLAAWRARYGSAHVPRRCFDAPDLGEWVRWLRKQKAEGRLPRWQRDRCARVRARRGARGGQGAAAARLRARQRPGVRTVCGRWPRSKALSASPNPRTRPGSSCSTSNGHSVTPRPSGTSCSTHCGATALCTATRACPTATGTPTTTTGWCWAGGRA